MRWYKNSVVKTQVPRRTLVLWFTLTGCQTPVFGRLIKLGDLIVYDVNDTTGSNFISSF